jgi:DNA-binding NarL/FixJ family response regulator
VSQEEILPLSARQMEVLELLAEGVPARQIAVELGLAEATVRNHIRAVLRKLGCHSQLEAVAVAYRLDLLDRKPPSVTS